MRVYREIFNVIFYIYVFVFRLFFSFVVVAVVEWRKSNEPCIVSTNYNEWKTEKKWIERRKVHHHHAIKVNNQKFVTRSRTILKLRNLHTQRARGNENEINAERKIIIIEEAGVKNDNDDDGQWC